MQLIANMFPFDGDLAGTGAPLDPLFWLTLGSVERLYQKSVFSHVIFSDMDYQRIDENACSGHEARAKKAWLQGLDLRDVTLSADELSTEELTKTLDPTRCDPLIRPLSTHPINTPH